MQETRPYFHLAFTNGGLDGAYTHFRSQLREDERFYVLTISVRQDYLYSAPILPEVWRIPSEKCFLIFL